MLETYPIDMEAGLFGKDSDKMELAFTDVN